MTIIIRIVKLFLLICTLAFFIQASCNKNETKACYNFTPYSFAVTFQLLNEREVYNVNDTITLISSFPKILTDYSSLNPTEINYGNSAGITGNLGAGFIDSINHRFIDAVDSFLLISVIGSVIDDTGSPASARSFYYEESDTSYELKFFIIPKKRGNYIIGISDLASKGLRGMDCTNAGFSVVVTNANKHFDILLNASIPGVSLDQSRIDHSYCFRVQ